MNADEMSDEEIVRFVATLKRVRERGDEGRTAVVRAADLGAVIDGWLTALHERDEARAEVERLRASETGRREFTAAVLDSMRQIGREEEREACVMIATPYAARWPCAGDIVAKIRARGAGGAR